mmetsp:Transcript_41134/g.75153  ORF Transcript_41134/g.75153 Transcript_41134/m.75153 type:complete len:276 (-) Transcript_41134:811-1638(-)
MSCLTSHRLHLRTRALLPASPRCPRSWISWWRRQHRLPCQRCRRICHSLQDYQMQDQQLPQQSHLHLSSKHQLLLIHRHQQVRRRKALSIKHQHHLMILVHHIQRVRLQKHPTIKHQLHLRLIRHHQQVRLQEHPNIQHQLHPMHHHQQVRLPEHRSITYQLHPRWIHHRQLVHLQEHRNIKCQLHLGRSRHHQQVHLQGHHLNISYHLRLSLVHQRQWGLLQEPRSIQHRLRPSHQLLWRRLLGPQRIQTTTQTMMTSKSLHHAVAAVPVKTET